MTQAPDGLSLAVELIARVLVVVEAAALYGWAIMLVMGAIHSGYPGWPNWSYSTSFIVGFVPAMLAWWLVWSAR